jgi:hypothetical protein
MWLIHSLFLDEQIGGGGDYSPHTWGIFGRWESDAEGQKEFKKPVCRCKKSEANATKTRTEEIQIHFGKGNNHRHSEE